MSSGPKDFRDERYRADEKYVYGTEPNDFLAAVVAGLPAMRSALPT